MRAVTIITGASSGIGRELARLAAREGEVMLVARGVEALEALADEINRAGGKARWLPVDGTHASAVADIDAYLAANRLYCDQLVNNAGFGLIGLADALAPAEQIGSVDLNVRFLTDLTLAVLPSMRQRGRGGILNVGSVAGFLPGPGMAVYYATKAYVHAFSDSLWQELRGTGVRVTALAPGPVNTGFLARATSGSQHRETSLLHLEAAVVAAKGWAGFRAGQRLVVPGLFNRLLLLVAAMLPRRVVASLIMRQQRRRAS